MLVFFDGILSQLEAKTYVTLYVLRCLVIQVRVWRCAVPSNDFVEYFGEIVLSLLSVPFSLSLRPV